MPSIASRLNTLPCFRSKSSQTPAEDRWRAPGSLFYVEGTDAEIREFFHRLCEKLRALPLDRPTDEARLLETEAQSRQDSALGSLLGTRYGARAGA